MLTGTDGLAAGLDQGLWADMSEHEDTIGNPDYLEPAADMAELAQGKGVALVYYPSGPLIQYNPDAVDDPPTTPRSCWTGRKPTRSGSSTPSRPTPGPAAPG